MLYPKIDEYIEHMKTKDDLSDDALATHQRHTKRFREYLINNSDSLSDLLEVNSKQANRYIKSFLGKGYSKSNVYEQIYILRQLFSFLGVELLISKNITNEIGEIYYGINNSTIISEESFCRVIDFCKKEKKLLSVRDVAIIEILWDTGMSFQALSLLDLQSVKVKKEGVFIEYISKNGRYNILTSISTRTAVALYEYIHRGRKLMLKRAENEHFLFLSMYGKKMKNSGVGSIVRKRFKNAGFEKVGYEVLRSSYIYNLRNKNLENKVE